MKTYVERFVKLCGSTRFSKKNKYVIRTRDVNLRYDSIMYIFIYLSYKMRKDFVLQIDYWKIHRTLAFLDISRKP